MTAIDPRSLTTWPRDLTSALHADNFDNRKEHCEAIAVAMLTATDAIAELRSERIRGEERIEVLEAEIRLLKKKLTLRGGIA